jgi:hypothetical protein
MAHPITDLRDHYEKVLREITKEAKAHTDPSSTDETVSTVASLILRKTEELKQLDEETKRKLDELKERLETAKKIADTPIGPSQRRLKNPLFICFKPE